VGPGFAANVNTTIFSFVEELVHAEKMTPFFILVVLTGSHRFLSVLTLNLGSPKERWGK